LITDPDNRIALSILKSLARRRVETAVTAENALALSFFSRYCKKSIYCPSASRDLRSFAATIQHIARKSGFLTVFPVSDVSLIAISEHRDKLSPYMKLPLPKRESVKKTFDKSLTMEAAAESGIPQPRTFSIHNTSELKDAARKITYPAVIKPKWSWVWNRKPALHARPYYVNSSAELIRSYEAVHREFPFPLIQEYIPGHNVSVAVLADNSKPKAACCIRVYRTMPVTGGNSVLRESIDPDPVLLDYAYKLLKALEWHGVAEVEFRIDSRDKIPKLMEINGRFWASVDVAIESGIDFPYLLYRLVNGDNINPEFTYRKGVKSRWFIGDVQNLFATLKGEPRLARIKKPDKLKTLLSFLKFYEKDMHYDCFSFDDPLPFFILGRMLNLLLGSKRKLASGAGSV